jgi:hypothetical protein
MPHATESEECGSVATTVESLPSSAPVDIINQHEVDHAEQQSQEVSCDVQTTLHYLSPNTTHSKCTPPIQVVTKATTYHDPRTSVKLSQGPSETVHDVRGREHEFGLGKNGFLFTKHRSVTGELESRERIWREYVETECKEVVSRAFGGRDGGVDEVIAFHEGVSLIQILFRPSFLSRSVTSNCSHQDAYR